MSDYVDGELSWRERRRLELHAQDCPDCGPAIRALRSLLRLLHGVAVRHSTAAPQSVFDRVRADAAGTHGNEAGADQA